MVLLGTLVNGLAIIIGSLIGTQLRNIPERVKVTVMQAIALSVVIIGIGMGLKSENFLVVIGSLAVGSIIGEKWDIEDKLNRLGNWLEKKAGAKEEGSFAKGFVSATLIYLVGAMAILGSLDSGLRNDHAVLYTKSMLDGFSSILFTSTLGIGVLFSAFPVIIYQGTIAILSTQIVQFVPQEVMDTFIVEMTATGGIMILAIGLNILGITKIRVANLLPAIIVVAIIVVVLNFFK